MNGVSFTWLSLRGRKNSSLLTIIVITLAVALIFSVIRLSQSLEQGLKQQAGTYDLVVGAEGSSMQLVLSSLLRLDTPLGNIPYALYNKMKEDQRVLRAVPIALGDSYVGFPIVGTTQEYFMPFRDGLPDRFQLASGSWFAQPGEAVVGASIAKQLNIKLGDHFHGNHGLGEGGQEHGELIYEVMGIMSPTGGADDRAVFTSLESVWEVHGMEHGKVWNSQEITALLLKPQQLGYVPRLKDEIDLLPEVQAVYPVQVFRKLLNTFEMGKQFVYLLSGISIGLAILFILFALLGTMQQRRQEMGILRSLGVPRKIIALNLVLETGILSAAGTAFGFLFSQLIVYLAGVYSENRLGIPLIPVPINGVLIKSGLVMFLASITVNVIPIAFFYFLYARSGRRSYEI